MKKYKVKEIFFSIQGEGYWSGKVSIFIRLAGCNLWSGRERGRHKAICQFCDTDFVGGTAMTAAEIIDAVKNMPTRHLIFTGGEPALQIDNEIVRALQRHNFFVAVETNGTTPLPSALDWVCVSPKANTEIVVDRADEMKLVFPQDNLPPHIALLKVRAKHNWLSPMDGPNIKENTALAVAFALNAPTWRVTMQSHKLWGIR